MTEAITPTRHLSVFISYAKQDEKVADSVQNFLNQAGYRASTFTTSVSPGDRWISSISLSLETADAVIILLSRAALESPWVLYEISASIASVERSSYKRVIPVALSKDLAPSGVLAQYQWIITSGDPREVANAVIQALQEPHAFDKAQERSEARQNLQRVQYFLDIEKLRWDKQQDQRLARALRIVAVALALVLLAIAISVTVLAKPHSAVIATLFAVLPAVATGLVGYFFGRGRQGVSDDRPRD
jgi:hypothetical protein